MHNHHDQAPTPPPPPPQQSFPTASTNLTPCPHCGAELDCHGLSGLVACPHCHGQFTVPVCDQSDDVLPIISDPTPMKRSRPPAKRSIGLSIRSVRQFFFFIFYVGLGVLTAVWFLPFGYRWSWYMSDALTACVVSTLTCPGCGFTLSAIDRWSSGSFNDHRERHILNVRSPIDGSVVGHTNCPQCDCTIIVR